MNVNTMTISGDEAARKVRQYSAIPASRRTDDDEYLLRVYKAVGKDKRLIDMTRAFRQTGLHANGYPKLGLARAATEVVYFHPRVTFDLWSLRDGAGGFSPRPVWDHRATRLNYALPVGTFDNDKLVRRSLKSHVPHIPPEHRPAASLSGYWILFEAVWDTYPIDPFLLKQVSGSLFTIEAEWELTPIEAELLSAIHST